MAETSCYACGSAVAGEANNCAHCGQPLLLRERYRIKRILGQGGFGIVYEAFESTLRRRYAIKVINTVNPAVREQVEIEGQILAQHARRLPFMPEIYDIWSDTGRTVLVMEYIDGVTLGAIIERYGPWPPAIAAQFLRTMLANLAILHSLEVVHRDIKPDNIKRTPDGRYVLLDFGIAKRSSTTETGAKAFSLFYAPLEQTRGRATDQRSDLYSLAATVYHLLTGHAPTPAETRTTMQASLLPPSHFSPRTPPALDATLLAMLELNPARRPDRAEDALELLDSMPSSAGMATIAAPKALQASAPAPSSAGIATIAAPVAPAKAPAAPKAPPAPAAQLAQAAPGAKRRWPWIAGVGLAALLGSGALFLAQDKEPLAATVPSVTAAPGLASTTIPTATFAAIAEAPSPTIDPASVAGAEPILVPTAEPTSVPTSAPTAEPTAAPTAEPTSAPTAEPTAALPSELAALLDAVNQQRAARGIAALIAEPQLSQAAQAHSDDMAANNIFGALGTDGADVKARIDRSGFVVSKWVQLIGGGPAEAGDVVSRWSAENPAVLFDPEVTRIGLGHTARAGSQYGHYWVIVLAKP